MFVPYEWANVGFLTLGLSSEFPCFSVYRVIYIPVNCSYQFKYPRPAAVFPALSGRQSLTSPRPSPIVSSTYAQREYRNSCKSFRPTLLRRTLHRFSAVASVNHLAGITYPQIRENSRKSNAAILLPHFLPVSPLLHYSYKKMGGAPLSPCLPASLGNYFPASLPLWLFASSSSRVTLCSRTTEERP
jgi:hypothetical protein